MQKSVLFNFCRILSFPFLYHKERKGSGLRERREIIWENHLFHSRPQFGRRRQGAGQKKERGEGGCEIGLERWREEEEREKMKAGRKKEERKKERRKVKVQYKIQQGFQLEYV